MRTAMTDLLNIKLVLLFVWIAAVIVLSHIDQARPAHRRRRGQAGARARNQAWPAETSG